MTNPRQSPAGGDGLPCLRRSAGARATFAAWANALLLPLALLAAALPCAYAAGPAWWTQRGVLDADAPANDFAAATQGQLKWIATNACDELAARLPGGAGAALAARIAALPRTGNFLPVSLGQLKALAAPFYDRLVAAGCTDGPPWTATALDDNDGAPANLGQVKRLFAFSACVTSTDADGDGLDDAWELAQFGSLSQTADMDSDGDGLTNLREYEAGTLAFCADSDGDGVTDGEEARGLSDVDRDGDGLADDWERYWFGGLAQNADGDRDGDGRSNGEEAREGTDPTRADLAADDRAISLAIYTPAEGS